MSSEKVISMEKLVDKISSELHGSFLREMQAKMHRCAATCCEDKGKTYEETQRCVENCSQPLNNVKRFVESEFKTFQSRLERCLMECNDSIQDTMSPNPSESEMKRHVSDFDKCAEKCFEKNGNLIPVFLKKVKEYASNYQQ